MVASHSQTTTAVGESQPQSRANSVKGPKAEYDAAGSNPSQSLPHQKHSEPEPGSVIARSRGQRG